MRRVKIFPIDERALIDILSCWKEGQFIQLPSSPKIPDGCKVVSTHHSWECGALMVMLEHESFPEVPYGDEPPRGEFIDYEALERIPVADKFRLPIHDPSRICLNCQWFFQNRTVRRYQIENPGKMCIGQCRRCTQYQANGKDPAPFPELYADGYCGGFTHLKYPLPFPSSFPPPKITSLERWLVIANTEKYTALPPVPPMTLETAAQTNKIVGHFQEVGRKLFRAREDAAIRAVKGESNVPEELNDPKAPKNWSDYHHKDCWTQYRGCHPRLCPKDQYEKTGNWRSLEELQDAEDSRYSLGCE